MLFLFVVMIINYITLWFENLVISDKCKTDIGKFSSNVWFENLVISDKCKTC